MASRASLPRGGVGQWRSGTDRWGGFVPGARLIPDPGPRSSVAWRLWRRLVSCSVPGVGEFPSGSSFPLGGTWGDMTRPLGITVIGIPVVLASIVVGLIG